MRISSSLMQQLVMMLFVGVPLALSAGCRRRHVAPATPLEAKPAPAAEGAPSPTPPTYPGEEVPPPPPPPPAAAPRPAAPPAGPSLAYSATPDGGTAATINGHPDGPKADEMNKILKASLPKMESCLNASTELEYGKAIAVQVAYGVGNDGKPTDVKVSGPVSAVVQKCITSQVEATSYPQFGGPPIQHSFPLNYQREWKSE